MIGVKRIFPECHADTLLVKLILQRGSPVHYEGIPNVAIAMKKITSTNVIIIGVVDDDKYETLPTFIREFKPIPNESYIASHGLTFDGNSHELVDFIQSHRKTIEQQNLIILQYPGTQKYLIKLKPAFEKWLLATGRVCNIHLEDTKYKGHFKKFRDDAKDSEVYFNTELKKFINSIVLANPPAIETLKFWLNKALG